MRDKGTIGFIFLAILFYLLFKLFVLLKSILIIISILLIPVFLVALMFVFYQFYYFKSTKFKAIKTSIKSYVNNCNELNQHIEFLKSSFIELNSTDYGTSQLSDYSVYNFRRPGWLINSRGPQIYNCSSTICKNASNHPIKYLCKYFNIDISEQSLDFFESVLNDFTAADQGKTLLQKEREHILNQVANSIPWVVYKFSKNLLIKKLGFDPINFSDLHFPIYTFQYISPGGNSTVKCDIKLDLYNLEKLIIYLNELISFRKSIKGQRALLTLSLREKIKSRDNYTCQKCTISVFDENNLLLEIDHIVPLSRGGLTTEDNLQTLCWRCNRSKGAKLV